VVGPVLTCKIFFTIVVGPAFAILMWNWLGSAWFAVVCGCFASAGVAVHSWGSSLFILSYYYVSTGFFGLLAAVVSVSYAFSALLSLALGNTLIFGFLLIVLLFVILVCIAMVASESGLSDDERSESKKVFHRNSHPIQKSSLEYGPRRFESVGPKSISIEIPHARSKPTGSSISSSAVQKKKPNRKSWGPKVRVRIFMKCGKKCHYCGDLLSSWIGAHMHLDHVTPLSKGGLDEESNLVAACKRCNQEKSDEIFPELKEEKSKK
jgi:5-methylcytosine-specific restriction endonuclease McrA